MAQFQFNQKQTNELCTHLTKKDRGRMTFRMDGKGLRQAHITLSLSAPSPTSTHIAAFARSLVLIVLLQVEFSQWRRDTDFNTT